MSENNNKQYLVYFCKHVAFLRVFFIKELHAPLSFIHFFTRREILWMKLLPCLNKNINIYKDINIHLQMS